MVNDIFSNEDYNIRRNTTLGIVTKVFPHTKSSDISNHEVNVKMVHNKGEFRRIPVHVNRNGHIYVPKKGDFVTVNFLSGVTTKPFVSGFAYDSKNRAPLGKSGHWRNVFGSSNAKNNIFLEAEPKDHSSGDAETLRMAIKSDGLSNPIARIELDQSGSETVLRLTRGEEEKGNTDMGIMLNFTTGEFKIGDGSGFGIVSDGSGNFKWYENSVDFVSDGSTITW